MSTDGSSDEEAFRLGRSFWTVEFVVKSPDSVCDGANVPVSLISPYTPAAGPVVPGQPMVLGPRYRHCAGSAPDKSSLIPLPPGLVRDERHCLGSEGEL